MLESRAANTNWAKTHTAQSQIPEDLQLGQELLTRRLEGHMTNKTLIPLQSLISSFLELPVNRQVAVGTIEGSVSGYLVAVAQGG